MSNLPPPPQLHPLELISKHASDQDYLNLDPRCSIRRFISRHFMLVAIVGFFFKAKIEKEFRILSSIEAEISYRDENTLMLKIQADGYCKEWLIPILKIYTSQMFARFIIIKYTYYNYPLTIKF